MSHLGPLSALDWVIAAAALGFMRTFLLTACLLVSWSGLAWAQPQPAAAGPAPEPAPLPAQPAAGPAPAASAPVEAAAAAPTAAAPTGAASAEELAELRTRLDALESQQAEASASAEEDDQRFKIYGFLDFGLKKSFPAADPFFAALIERKTTFVLGNINLYFDAQPAPGWRGLIEARLTTYPHGAETVDASGQFQRTDTRVFDTNSPSGRNHVIWGGVILERAQIEHTIADLFNLRVGYFLTPYGIWNVDHGTPTLISLVLPAFQVEEAMPARQLGVQAYGSTTVGDLELGYAAYVTNGRAPYLEDPTDGKAVGARTFATFSGPSSTLKLGLSGYVGDSLEKNKQLVFDANGNPNVITSNKYRYKEWSVGGDLALDYKKLRIRTEGLVHRVDHGNSPHEPINLGEPGTTHPDRYEYFWYSIFAYRLGDFEPYTYTELKYTSPRDGSFDLTYLPGLGLNIYFRPTPSSRRNTSPPSFIALPRTATRATTTFACSIRASCSRSSLEEFMRFYALFPLLLAASLAPACTQDEATACGKGAYYQDGACHPGEPEPVTPSAAGGAGGEAGQAPVELDPAFGADCSSTGDCAAPTDYCVPKSPFDVAYCSTQGCADASECPPDWTCTNVGQFMTGEPYACTRPFPNQ